MIEFPLFHPSWFWLGLFLYALLNKLGFIFSFNDELKLSKPLNYPYPAKLSAFQAKLGMSQLKNLENNIKHRRELGLELEKRFHRLGEKLAEDSSNHVFLRYSFLVKDRKKFINQFRANFDLGIWFESIAHGRKSEFDKIGYLAGSCPVAEETAKHIVNFPTHERIDPEFLFVKINNSFASILNNIKGLR